MTPTPWPPTPEQLEAWAKEASRTSSLLNYVEGDDPLGDIAAFLRSPRLREALELAEEQRALVAVALWWWEEHRPVKWGEAEHLENPTVNAHGSDGSRVLAESVGAYVRSLREKIEKEPPQ